MLNQRAILHGFSGVVSTDISCLAAVHAGFFIFFQDLGLWPDPESPASGRTVVRWGSTVVVRGPVRNEEHLLPRTGEAQLFARNALDRAGIRLEGLDVGGETSVLVVQAINLVGERIGVRPLVEPT